MPNQPIYLDPTRSPKERAQDLLKELSLEEKLAQLNCIFPLGDEYGDAKTWCDEMPWGAGEVSTLEMRRIQTLEEAAAWQRAMQRRVMENSPHHIPAIFHMEGLCGAFIQEATSFPDGLARWHGRKLPAGSRTSLHRCWILPGMPEWGVRVKATAKIRRWLPRWGLPTPAACR